MLSGLLRPPLSAMQLDGVFDAVCSVVRAFVRCLAGDGFSDIGPDSGESSFLLTGCDKNMSRRPCADHRSCFSRGLCYQFQIDYVFGMTARSSWVQDVHGILQKMLFGGIIPTGLLGRADSTKSMGCASYYAYRPVYELDPGF